MEANEQAVEDTLVRHLNIFAKHGTDIQLNTALKVKFALTDDSVV